MDDNQKMDKRTEIDRFESSSPENRRLLKQEELILEVTEMLSTALEESGVSQAELARRLGKSKGFVSQLFAGGRNVTLRTISDVADALGVRVVVTQGRASEPYKRVISRTAIRWVTKSQETFRKTDFSVHAGLQMVALENELYAA